MNPQILAKALMPFTAGTKEERGYRPVGDYGVIGDCYSSALVASDGSIDFCCLPCFDSGAVFCRLLDKNKGGFFQVRPKGMASGVGGKETIKRCYLENTNVLATEFSVPGGLLQLTDLMPFVPSRGDTKGQDVEAPHAIIRRARCTEGEVEVELNLKATFEFAMVPSKVQIIQGKGAIFEGLKYFFVLRFSGPLSETNGVLHGTVRLARGEKVDFVFRYAKNRADAERFLGAFDVDQHIEQTIGYWHKWVKGCRYDGLYKDVVIRSALTLKLMTFEPTGAIIASPTTSIPEEIGGERNWDYRYTWMRDATFMLLALLRLGYVGEARDFLHFVMNKVCAHHVKTQTPLHLMYAIDGTSNLTEQRLTHLEGYSKSGPVRIGNAAHNQKQLDIYGEILDCVHMFYQHGGFGERGRHMTEETWQLIEHLVEYAAAHWREKDEGIWEVRSAPRHFVYSKVMCWVALNRGIRLAEDLGKDVDLNRWRSVLHKIHESIMTEGYDPDSRAFTQCFGSKSLDAALLRIPLVKFLSACDEKMKSTIEAIKDVLMQNGLVYRYLDLGDGLSGKDATFTACGFWLVNCLALMGKKEEGHEVFQKIMGYGNDLGLFSEEIDASSGQQLGNFPQAFTHIAIINAAAALTEAQEGVCAPAGTE